MILQGLHTVLTVDEVKFFHEVEQMVRPFRDLIIYAPWQDYSRVVGMGYIGRSNCAM